MTMTAPTRTTVPAFVLGDRLRKAREHAGLDKHEMAEAIGIHRESVTRYEHSSTSIKRPVLLAWSMVTGVDLEWLETGKAPSEDGARSDVRPEGFEPPAY